MKLWNGIALVLVALGAFSPVGLLAQNRVERARAQVMEANDRELAAVMEGDAAEAASWFLEDALLLPPDGSLVKGRDAIEEFWTPQPGTRITGAETELEAFDLQGDMAYLVGSYALEVESEGETSTSEGRFFMIWRRTAEGWRIEVDMWS